MCAHAQAFRCMLMPCVGEEQVMERDSVLKQWPWPLPVDADKYLENKLCVKVELVVGLLYFLLFLFILL